MKLPGWQPSINTAMPMKSPAIQRDPAMVQARTMRFVPLNDPDDYLRLGQAKASKYEAIGNVAIKAIEVYDEIDLSNQTARGSAIETEYADWSGKKRFDNTVGSPFTTPGENIATTEGAWEYTEEQYREEAKAKQEELLEKSGITRTDVKAKIMKSFAGADKSAIDGIRTYVNDQRVSQGRASIYYKAETANSEADIVSAFALGKNTKLFNAEDAQDEAFKYVRQFRYRKSLEMVEAIELQVDQMTGEQLDETINVYEDLVLSQDWGLNPSDAIKVQKRLDDLRDSYEDRQKVIGDAHTQDFLERYLNPKSDKVALQREAFDRPPVYWGGNEKFIYSLVREGATRGVNHIRTTGPLSQDIRRWGMNDKTVTSQDLLERIGDLPPDTDTPVVEGLLQQYKTARELRMDKRIDVIGSKLAMKMGFADFGELSSYARENRGSDPEAAKFAVIGTEILLEAKEKLDVPAPPAIDWDSWLNRRLIEKFELPPVMYTSDKKLTSDLKKADPSHTIDVFDTYLNDVETFKRDNRAKYPDGLAGMPPERRAQFRKEFIEWRMTTKGRSEVDARLPANVLYSPREVGPILRSLRLYAEIYDPDYDRKER